MAAAKRKVRRNTSRNAYLAPDEEPVALPLSEEQEQEIKRRSFGRSVNTERKPSRFEVHQQARLMEIRSTKALTYEEIEAWGALAYPLPRTPK
jgi:hypothetical protein